MSARELKLTKSNYIAGLQCPKRLYLERYHDDRRDPLSEDAELRIEEGTKVGELARRLVPGGVLIEEKAGEHDLAVERTHQAMAKGVPAVFEGAIRHGKFIARVDILKRVGEGEWDLWEVKSSLAPEVKEEHLQDVAFQWWVARSAGLKVNRAGLVLLSRDYVYPGGEYEPEKMFRVVDVTEKVKGQESTVAALAYKGLEILQGDLPDVSIGPHCEKPYGCPFLGFCHQDRPPDHIWSLPRLGEVYSQLVNEGVERIGDIPEGFCLNSLQERVRSVVKSGQPYVSAEGLRDALKVIEPPIHFMDFEVVQPALPIFAGTRAFQEIPFQWSLHILSADGRLDHYEYVHQERTDPRRSFCETLRSALRDKGTIVIYSKYEMRLLRSLAGWNSELAGGLAETLCERGWDLHRVLKDHVYLSEFGGRFSLKVVARALLEKDVYGDLGIREGGTASARYMRFLHGEEEAKGDLFRDLLAYCSRDTEALVHLYHKLREFAGLSFFP